MRAAFQKTLIPYFPVPLPRGVRGGLSTHSSHTPWQERVGVYKHALEQHAHARTHDTYVRLIVFQWCNYCPFLYRQYYIINGLGNKALFWSLGSSEKKNCQSIFKIAARCQSTILALLNPINNHNKAHSTVKP